MSTIDNPKDKEPNLENDDGLPYPDCFYIRNMDDLRIAAEEGWLDDGSDDDFP